MKECFCKSLLSDPKIESRRLVRIIWGVREAEISICLRKGICSPNYEFYITGDDDDLGSLISQIQRSPSLFLNYTTDSIAGTGFTIEDYKTILTKNEFIMRLAQFTNFILYTIRNVMMERIRCQDPPADLFEMRIEWIYRPDPFGDD